MAPLDLTKEENRLKAGCFSKAHSSPLFTPVFDASSGYHFLFSENSKSLPMLFSAFLSSRTGFHFISLGITVAGLMGWVSGQLPPSWLQLLKASTCPTWEGFGDARGSQGTWRSCPLNLRVQYCRWIPRQNKTMPSTEAGESWVFFHYLLAGWTWSRYLTCKVLDFSLLRNNGTWLDRNS